MPVYEYACDNCGCFTALRPMATRDDPVSCPLCATPAPRVMLTAPAFAGMSMAARRAHATNEQARHEPKKLSSYHGAGCGCCNVKPAVKNDAPAAAKSFPGSRPWMISH